MYIHTLVLPLQVLGLVSTHPFEVRLTDWPERIGFRNQRKKKTIVGTLIVSSCFLLLAEGRSGLTGLAGVGRCYDVPHDL